MNKSLCHTLSEVSLNLHNFYKMLFVFLEYGLVIADLHVPLTSRPLQGGSQAVSISDICTLNRPNSFLLGDCDK